MPRTAPWLVIAAPLVCLLNAAPRSWLLALQLGKFFALPPGTPAPVVAAYRAAFRAMQEDGAFKPLAAAQLDADYQMIDADSTPSLIAALAGTPDADLDFLLRLREKFTSASLK